MSRDLKSELFTRTRPAELFEDLGDGRLRCLACAHRCPISEGHDGVCKVRGVRDGVLRAPTGYVAGLQVDPIEKKPFYHVLPANDALSFGMLGCDLHCAYCQNWISSQTLRDPDSVARPRDVTPERLVQLAEDEGAPVVVSTYNEPLITAEWAMEVFRPAAAAGLLCGFVSNGNATPEVLDYIRPVTSLYKIDLKAMNDRAYRDLGAPLEHILEGIRMVHERGFWLEIVTLVVPGINDSEDELRAMAGFLAGLSPLIPWHLTGYHPDYKLDDRGSTPVTTLLRAAEIAAEEGLMYVYCGNRPGQVGELENTRCHGCAATLIERRSFRVLSNRLGPSGRCPDCDTAIPGVWSHPKARARAVTAPARPRGLRV